MPWSGQQPFGTSDIPSAPPPERLWVGRRLDVSARGADSDGAEYARLWAMVNRAYPGYNYHRERAVATSC